MMLGHRQDGGALTLAPVLRGAALAAGAVAVAAGMIEEGPLTAGVAFQGEAAQGGGAAVQEVMTDLPLPGAEGMVLGVVREASADDRLQGRAWLRHGRPPGGR